MAKIHSTITHESGIPLGGLGTGSVEILPDGHFHDWQIFNMGSWAPSQPDGMKPTTPDMPPGALSFCIRTQEKGKEPKVRHLSLRKKQANPYSTPWFKNVDAIDFDGAYPMASLEYTDDSLPVKIGCRMFSPFIPHDSRTSGTPGFHAVFSIKNRSAKTVDVSLLGLLRNPLAAGAVDKKRTNSIDVDNDTAYLTMRTAADDPACRHSTGSLCFSVTGGTPGWITGDYTRFFIGYVPETKGAARTHEVVFHKFRDTGTLISSQVSTAPEEFIALGNEQIEALSLSEKKKWAACLSQYAFAETLFDQMRTVDPASLESGDGLTQLLKNLRQRLHSFERRDGKHQSWGDGALCSRISIPAGKTVTLSFALSWHLPYHYNKSGALIGHMYENWFADALDVNRFLVNNRPQHLRTVTTFSKALYDTTAASSWADAWSSQLSTFAKSTWWVKDGSFGIWEGLGCCGFHTTDISYSASFSTLALFPDLQLLQMEMTRAFQREDGRVPHMFWPDFKAIDNQFDRVDMNQQFVLLVCRDYLWTGNREYLTRMWPNIIKAMDSTAAIDCNGDGLPDTGTERNTYDDWHFSGTPAYIASLWMSALLAASRLAQEMGDDARFSQWQNILKKAKKSFDALLWNGRYYSMCVDGEKRDEACMTDQINGEWFTRLVGLGACIPEKRTMRTLNSVMKFNFTDEYGLCNACYPPGVRPMPSTYRNFQAVGTWSGIEYAVASMLLELGMPEQAGAVIESVHHRYFNSGRFWEHMECGEHYYRAMSSWTILQSLSGFKLDVPHGIVTVAPVSPGIFKAPWVATTGWGMISATKSSLRISCIEGSIAIGNLRTNRAPAKPKVRLGTGRIAVTVGTFESFTQIQFESPVVVKSGGHLIIG